MQRADIDCYETFAPVAKFSSIRLVIAIAAILELQLEQMNVVIAFLNPDVKEEIYIQVQEGMEFPKVFLHLNDRRRILLRLLKGLYGPQHYPKLWNDSVNATLTKLNCTRCDADPGLFVRREGKEFVIFTLYVDDLILASKVSRSCQCKAQVELQKD